MSGKLRSASMPAATVLIPTHDHAGPLRHSVGSVLRQTISDLELFIVGDGMSEATRAVAQDLAAGDGRVRLFDFPKGERKGERHRHQALKQASGRIVAYLGDDDLWMPHHLETLDALLRDADFANTMHVGLDGEGRMFRLAGDLAHPMAAFLYTVSCMHCMSVSLGNGGPGLGAMWGKELALKMLKEAGFGRVRVESLPHDMLNFYYVATP